MRRDTYAYTAVHVNYMSVPLGEETPQRSAASPGSLSTAPAAPHLPFYRGNLSTSLGPGLCKWQCPCPPPRLASQFTEVGAVSVSERGQSWTGEPLHRLCLPWDLQPVFCPEGSRDGETHVRDPFAESQIQRQWTPGCQLMKLRGEVTLQRGLESVRGCDPHRTLC